MELYILISLHNYFIMHGIKYFFLNKNNQTIQGGKKNFQGGHVPKTLPKSTIFQNPGGPLGVAGSAPADKCGLIKIIKILYHPRVSSLEVPYHFFIYTAM
jgi:hypothetical protein